MVANSAIISKVYYDLSGHGSMHETTKDAKDIDKSIECSVVKAWLDNRIKIKSAVKGTNSFVAKGPYQEYQLDLMCIKHLTKCFCIMLIYKYIIYSIDDSTEQRLKSFCADNNISYHILVRVSRSLPRRNYLLPV